MDYLLSAGYAWLLVLGLAVVVLLLGLAVVAVYGRAAGYAVRKGWDRAAERAVPAPRRLLVAPRGGGLCVVGHYIPGAVDVCWLGHAYSAKRTAGSTVEDIAAARHDRTVAENEAADRMAAGGW